MARKQKTKAQREYERLRKTVNQYKRRHGLPYELPLTPTQAKGKGNVKAADYREAPKELKQYYNQLKEKSEEYEEVPSYAVIIVENARRVVNAFPNKEGAEILIHWLDRMVDQYGYIVTADMLITAQEAGQGIEAMYGESNEEISRWILNVENNFRKEVMSKNEIETLRQYAENNEGFINV